MAFICLLRCALDFYLFVKVRCSVFFFCYAALFGFYLFVTLRFGGFIFLLRCAVHFFVFCLLRCAFWLLFVCSGALFSCLFFVCYVALFATMRFLALDLRSRDFDLGLDLRRRGISSVP